MTSNIKEFVLTYDDIKKIIQMDGGTLVVFFYGLTYHKRTKLRDSHVIGLLSNPDHVNKQKVEGINLRYCEGITDESLVLFIGRRQF